MKGIYCKRKTIGIVALAAIAFTVSLSAEADQTLRPVIHLQAPGYEYAKKFDPLVAATVLRLLEIDLAASHGIMAKYLPADQPEDKVYPRLKISGEPLGKEEANTGAHKINVVLAMKPGQKKTIASQNVSWATFAEMTDHIKALFEQAKQALASELKLSLSVAEKGPAATAEEFAALDKAREASLMVNSGKILAASRMVNEVLGKKSDCPEAHYTAAMCGAMLAYQDLFGYFHKRPRYLANPLAHWLFAKKLAAPKRIEDRLVGCWIRYICGYPNEAHEIIKTLPEKELSSPEVSAITMFLTRDFRPVSKEEEKGVSPIQWLAWMYAVQDCGATVDLDETPTELSIKFQTCAFLTHYTHAPVGLEHGYTMQGISFAIARDSYDLLTNDAIPASKRLAIGRELADALKIDHDGSVESLADRVSKTANTKDMEPNITATIAAMTKLYDAAMDSPGQTVRWDKAGPVWQTISLRDFAELQRGILLMRIQRRLRFIAYSWSVREKAIQLSKDVAKGLAASSPELSSYFDGFAICLTDEKQKRKTIANSIIASPLGELLTVKCGLVGTWAGFLGKTMDMQFSPGRGCWQWQLLTKNADDMAKYRDLRWQAINMLLASDRYSAKPISAYIWRTKSFHCVKGIEKRLEYDLNLQTDIAWIAQSMGKFKYAEKYYKEYTKSPRCGCHGYILLAELYVKMDKKDKAIQTAIEAAEKFEYTVQLSNLEGMLAVWLAEDGRLEESLHWGKKAARSYSSRGLNGFAVALEANGHIAKAHDVYRAKAHRYLGGLTGYVNFLLKHDFLKKKVLNEIQAIVDEYPQRTKDLARSISKVVCESHKGVGILQAAYAGPLSYVDKTAKQKHLNLCKANAKWFSMKGVEFSVDSKNSEGSPISTGIHLKKWQKFVIQPNPSDKWCGGGSMRGKYTGFRGYPERGAWMKMFFKLKNNKRPVSPGNQIATNDGELIFYCSDDRVDDNKGKIRIKVVVGPLRKTKAKRLSAKKAIFSVGSKNNESSPVSTGIYLKKGQKFILNPSRSDSWYGGGSMRGRSTGFRGYPGRGNWMKMFFKLKDYKQPVSPGNHIAANDGELIFYCFDGQVYDNKGRIRIKVVVHPHDVSGKTKQ